MENMGFAKRFVIPCLVQLWGMMLLYAVLAYISIYWIDLGFSHFQVGVLIAIFPLTSLVLMIPSGIFVDRISPKKLVMASQVIFAICVFGLTSTTDFWLTLVLLVIGGIGNSLFNNSAPALYYKTLGEKFRGIKLGVFAAMSLVGYGSGPLLGGFILSGFDMNAVFMFSLLGSIPLLVLCLFLPDVEGTRVSLTQYKTDLSNKSVLIFIILVFLVSMHIGVEQTSFSLYLNKDLDINKDAIGWLYFIQAMAMAILAVFNGFIGDRFTARGRGLAALFYTGIMISGLTNITLFFTTNFGTVLAVRLSHAVGDSLTIVTRSMIVSHLFIASRIGGNLGTVTTTATLGILVGSLLGGAMPSYTMGFVITGVLAILAIPIAIITKPDF